jgi:hypothetical protein
VWQLSIFLQLFSALVDQVELLELQAQQQQQKQQQRFKQYSVQQVRQQLRRQLQAGVAVTAGQAQRPR